MDGVHLAFILLALRLIATTLLGAVVYKQFYNIRNLHTDFPAVRFVIVGLTIVLLVGQLIPITLDSVVAFGNSYPGRNAHPNFLGAAYTLNNAVKDVVIGVLLTYLYYRPGGAMKR